MLNRIILVGRMAVDPELKLTSSGIPVCSFRIAVNRNFRSQSGEQEADFIDCVAWRQSAEFAANYLTKGRLIALEGRLQVRSYDAQDGSRRRAYEVVCDNLRGLDRPREGGEGGAPSGGGQGGGGSYSGPTADPHADQEPPGYIDPFEDQ